MMGKKFSRNPVLAILGANESKKEENNIQSGDVNKITENDPKVTEEEKVKIHKDLKLNEVALTNVAAAKEEKKEKKQSNEKFIPKQLKIALETSLRMSRILNELKNLDPENSAKYTQKFFIEEAISKSLNSYENKLGIK